jgi:hypothetical protein
MSWIDEISVDDAEGKLEAIYAELVDKRGKVSNILKVHSLNPEAMANSIIMPRPCVATSRMTRHSSCSCQPTGWKRLSHG